MGTLSGLSGIETRVRSVVQLADVVHEVALVERGRALLARSEEVQRSNLAPGDKKRADLVQDLMSFERAKRSRFWASTSKPRASYIQT